MKKGDNKSMAKQDGDSVEKMVNDRELYTVKGAAALLKVSTKTVQRMMKKKEIEFKKFPSGTVRITGKSLNNFILYGCESSFDCLIA